MVSLHTYADSQFFLHSLSPCSALEFMRILKIYEIQVGVCISIQIKYLNGIIIFIKKKKIVLKIESFFFIDYSAAARFSNPGGQAVMRWTKSALWL